MIFIHNEHYDDCDDITAWEGVLHFQGLKVVLYHNRTNIRYYGWCNRIFWRVFVLLSPLSLAIGDIR